ncbi:hypothetical protein MLD38_006212 [Melastoma candidum]|uniref:Uncharacterized protein n=1 Tax=Melastoma candidum TaxID=119954 RepID=A0ACB9RP29_9MYRT|nr:hypothetical protein MLD38_006212 [Melastoma candidum]
MGDPTEAGISSGENLTETSSETSFSESIGDIIPEDLPTGFEMFESDSIVPEGFEWCTCDLTEEECCAKVCDLLMDGEQKQGRGRSIKIHTTDYLRWSCCPPGYLPGLHVGIWDCSSRQLVAFVAAIPVTVRLMEESSRMARICYKVLRSDFRDRIPLKIICNEVIRRIRLSNIQWVISAKPTREPVSMAFPMWQRPLNSNKLFKIGTFQNSVMTLPEIVEFYELPRSPDIRGFKGMNVAHVRALTGLLYTYLQKFNLAPEFTEDDVKHWFLPRADLLHSYVNVTPNGEIIGFCSFITLRQPQQDRMLKLAFSFYNFTVGMPLQQLMRDAIIIARENQCDSFFVYKIMSNASFLTELRFFPSGWHIQYNGLEGLRSLDMDRIGLVLL